MVRNMAYCGNWLGPLLLLSTLAGCGWAVRPTANSGTGAPVFDTGNGSTGGDASEPPRNQPDWSQPDPPAPSPDGPAVDPTPNPPSVQDGRRDAPDASFTYFEYDAADRVLTVCLNYPWPGGAERWPDPAVASEWPELRGQAPGGLLATETYRDYAPYGGGGDWVFKYFIEAADPAAGANGWLQFWVLAPGGQWAISPKMYAVIPAVTRFPYAELAPDTLYAFPLATSVKVGEPVTVVIATGVPRHPFKYMTGIGLTLPLDGAYVAGSFDSGMPDSDANPQLPLDGIWEAIAPNGFLLAPDGWIVQGAEALDDGRRRWSFNLTPLSGPTLTRASGALCNMQFSFSTPGVKRLGFVKAMLDSPYVPRTYYDDEEHEYYWGDITNAGSVLPNSITVTE